MDLSTYVKSRVPVLLWGSPGIGKTQRWIRLAADLKRPIHVLIASIRDPTDFCGFPCPNVERRCVDYLPPSWAKDLGTDGIIFFDELSCARPAVQDALLRVVIDRVVGDYPLPEDVYVCAAANPPEQTASGFELSLPLQNRFAHVECKASAEEFANEFPTLWRSDRVCPYRAQIAAFINHSRDFLVVVPKQQDWIGSYSWPSPRSWEMAARLMKASDGKADIGSAVGVDAANAFLAWREKLRVPTGEMMLKGASWPTLPWEIIVAANNVLGSIEERPERLDEKTFAKALDVLGNAPAKDLTVTPFGRILRLRKDNWKIPDAVLAMAKMLDYTGES